MCHDVKSFQTDLACHSDKKSQQSVLVNWQIDTNVHLEMWTAMVSPTT